MKGSVGWPALAVKNCEMYGRTVYMLCKMPIGVFRLSKKGLMFGQGCTDKAS